jgi:transposase
MGVNAELVGLMGPQLEMLLPQLDEKSRRLVLGAVARAAGEGGITAVAKATGASWQTVANGAGELASGDAAAPGRVRRPGGGRKKLEEHDRQLIAALRELLEASTRGDPVSLLTWTTLSVRGIAAELTAAGHPCGKNAVLRMLHELGFSTQGNSRAVEGKRHPEPGRTVPLRQRDGEAVPGGRGPGDQHRHQEERAGRAVCAKGHRMAAEGRPAAGPRS